MKSKELLITLIGSAAITASATAAITYVDANATNTSGDAALDTVGGQDTGHWWIRDTFTAAINDDVFQAGNTENNPELTTTIAVANGTYNVYTFFWDSKSTGGANNWDINTGLASGVLTTYKGDAASDADDLAFTAPLAYDSDPSLSSTTLRYASLGEVTVTDGTLEVYVDTFADGASNRTEYEGFGYEAVPEPSSAALLGLGGLALILRRRK